MMATTTTTMITTTTTTSSSSSSSADHRQRPGRMPVPTPVLPGLTNIGNTCFANSVLQSLNASRAFAGLLTTTNLSSATHPLLQHHYRHYPSEPSPDALPNSWCPPPLATTPADRLPILSSLSALLYGLSTQTGSLKPLALLHKIAARHQDYRSNDQQDAHEFLHVLLDLVRSEESNVSHLCFLSTHTIVLELIHPHSPSFPTQFLNPKHSIPSSDEIHEAPPPIAQPSTNYHHPTLESIAIPPNNDKSLSNSHFSPSSSASSSIHSPHPSSSSPSSPLQTLSLTSSTISSASSVQPTHTPLLDALFAGRLTQYTVCEKLHVSKVPEDFLDLSLATKDLDLGLGKRARLRKHLQSRLKPSVSKSHLALDLSPTPTITPSNINGSDTINPLALSTRAQTPVNHAHSQPSPTRRSSVSSIDRCQMISSNSSPSPRRLRSASLESCQNFNLCYPFPGSVASSTTVKPSSDQQPSVKLAPPSRIIRFVRRSSIKKAKRPRQTDSQDGSPPPLPTATYPVDDSKPINNPADDHKRYVRDILFEPPKPASNLPNPLRALRFAQPNPTGSSALALPNSLGSALSASQSHTSQHSTSNKSVREKSPKPEVIPDTGLHSLLRKFTSVEVLEGENSFACKECWKAAMTDRKEQELASPSPPPLPSLKSPAGSPRPQYRNRPCKASSSPSLGGFLTISSLSQRLTGNGEGNDESEGFNDGSDSDIPTITIVARRRRQPCALNAIPQSPITSTEWTRAGRSSQEARLERLLDQLSLDEDNDTNRSGITPSAQTSSSATVSSLGISSTSPESMTSTSSKGAEEEDEEEREAVEATPGRSGTITTKSKMIATSGNGRSQPIGQRLKTSLSGLLSPTVPAQINNQNSGGSGKNMSEEPSEVKQVMVKAFKRYLFESLPPILTIHLKRFEPSSQPRKAGRNNGGGMNNGVMSFSGGGNGAGQMNSNGNCYQRMEWIKSEEYISFPERLDLEQFVVPEAKGSSKNVYGLFAVIVHVGQIGLGHYFAYVLSDRILNGSSHKREWVYCSDTEIRLASVEEVMKSKAYMIFYERL